ncbi:hypothetical protein MMC25_006191 [Agyrium rufum]|nr:hypothetical protein [Agyrium rufum]
MAINSNIENTVYQSVPYGEEAGSRSSKAEDQHDHLEARRRQREEERQSYITDAYLFNLALTLVSSGLLIMDIAALIVNGSPIPSMRVTALTLTIVALLITLTISLVHAFRSSDSALTPVAVPNSQSRYDLLMAEQRMVFDALMLSYLGLSVVLFLTLALGDLSRFAFGHWASGHVLRTTSVGEGLYKIVNGNVTITRI